MDEDWRNAFWNFDAQRYEMVLAWGYAMVRHRLALPDAMACHRLALPEVKKYDFWSFFFCLS